MFSWCLGFPNFTTQITPAGYVRDLDYFRQYVGDPRSVREVRDYWRSRRSVRELGQSKCCVCCKIHCLWVFRVHEEAYLGHDELEQCIPQVWSGRLSTDSLRRSKQILNFRSIKWLIFWDFQLLCTSCFQLEICLCRTPVAITTYPLLLSTRR